MIDSQSTKPSSLWPTRPTNSPDADGAGKLTSRLSTVGQRSDAGESSWRPSKSAEPVAHPERRCNGSSSGSPNPSRPGPSAEANPGRPSAVGPWPNANAQSAEAGRKLAELGA